MIIINPNITRNIYIPYLLNVYRLMDVSSGLTSNFSVCVKCSKVYKFAIIFDWSLVWLYLSLTPVNRQ